MNDIVRVSDHGFSTTIVPLRDGQPLFGKTVGFVAPGHMLVFTGDDQKVHRLRRYQDTLHSLDDENVVFVLEQMSNPMAVKTQELDAELMKSLDKEYLDKAVKNFVELMVGPEVKEEEKSIGKHTARIQARRLGEVQKVRDLFTKAIEEQVRKVIDNPECGQKFKSLLLTGSDENKQDQASRIMKELYTYNIFKENVKFHYLGVDDDLVKSLLELCHALICRAFGDSEPIKAWSSGQIQISVKNVDNVESCIQQNKKTFHELFLEAARSKPQSERASG